MSCPSNRIAPAVGVSCNRISFEVVVLPQPDSPMTPRVSPAPTAKSMPSTAFTQAVFLRGNSAVVTGKCLVRPSISNSGGGMDFLCGIDDLWLGEPAPGRPRATDLYLWRFFESAARQRRGAARVKGAARRQGGEIGRLARDGEQLLLAAELRHRAKQRLGVGMLRGVEQLAHRAGLDNLAGIHDRELVAHARDDAEVVGHENNGDPGLLLEILQEVEI